MTNKINIYEDKSFFKWLQKIGNYIHCPKCNSKFDPGNSLTKSTFYCTNCNILWKFRRHQYNWKKWSWFFIPRKEDSDEKDTHS